MPKPPKAIPEGMKRFAHKASQSAEGAGMPASNCSASLPCKTMCATVLLWDGRPNRSPADWLKSTLS